MKRKISLVLPFILEAVLVFGQIKTDLGAEINSTIPFNKQISSNTSVLTDNAFRYQQVTDSFQFLERNYTFHASHLSRENLFHENSKTNLDKLQSDESNVWLDSIMIYWYHSDRDSVLGSKRIIRHTQNGRLVESKGYRWSCTNDECRWQLDLGTVYSRRFNDDGKITQEVSTFFKSEYSYNLNGKLAYQIGYESINYQWVLTYKWEYVYDSNGMATSMLTYGFSMGAWNLANKQDYFYDSIGNITLWVSYNRDTENNNWIFKDKDVYYYDENGHDTLQLGYKAYSGGTLEDCYLNDKYVAKYDSDGYVISEAWYRLTQNNQWEGEYKYTYLYDENKNHKVDIGYSWDEEQNNWKLDGKWFRYKLIPHVSSINQIANLECAIYPNPFTNNITIKSDNITGKTTFKLFDLNGNKLIEKDIPAFSTISLEELPHGLYIYTLQLNGHLQSGKLVKQ